MSELKKQQNDWIIDQAAQVLNLKDNDEMNFSKTTYMYPVFTDVLKEAITPEFELSMKQSEKCHLNKDSNLLNSLKGLIKNEPNSFVISPLSSSTHFFCALIRKTDEGFSATVINRGSRDSASPYMEYIFDDISKLKSVLMENHYDAYEIGKSNKDIYTSFRQASKPEIKPYRLSVFSRSQKRGNCVVKEPEAAIKYAFVTRGFTSQDLKELRKKGRDFHPKWQPSTEAIHRLYIQTLIKRHRDLKEKLNQLLSQYTRGKIKKPRLVRCLDTGVLMRVRSTENNMEGDITKTENISEKTSKKLTRKRPTREQDSLLTKLQKKPRNDKGNELLR